MGDSTQFLLRVDGGSPEVRKALVDVYVDYTFPSFGSDRLEALDYDALCEGAEWREGSVAASAEIHARFVDELEGVKPVDLPTYISLVEDARYEYNGDLYRFKPELGWHAATIDNTGEVHISPALVRTWIETAGDTDVLMGLWEEHVGDAWEVEGYHAGSGTNFVREVAPGSRPCSSWP